MKRTRASAETFRRGIPTHWLQRISSPAWLEPAGGSTVSASTPAFGPRRSNQAPSSATRKSAMSGGTMRAGRCGSTMDTPHAPDGSWTPPDAALARRLGVKQARAARLIAFYAIGDADPDFQLNRNVVEAVPDGWWYAARLPSGAPVAGFHTHVRKDARFDRDSWARALAGTRHISAILRPTQFEQTLRALDAGSARLTKFSGEGWIACGDAAMSFDPISGQGIFSALHSGMKSGKAVAASLGGDVERFDDYARQMDDVWRIYRMRAQAVYRSERRWVDEPFWSLARQ
jgi:hypothetical protein